jgi:hypothetical protein
MPPSPRQDGIDPTPVIASVPSAYRVISDGGDI